MILLVVGCNVFFCVKCLISSHLSNYKRPILVCHFVGINNISQLLQTHFSTVPRCVLDLVEEEK